MRQGNRKKMPEKLSNTDAAHVAKNVSTGADHDSDAEKAGEKAYGIIPQLFYDIIARIIPGTAFIVGIAWHKLPDFKTEFLGPGWNVLLLAGLGYVVGLLLTGFSLIWSGIFALAALKPEWQHHSPIILAYSIDAVSMKNKRFGEALFKMLAEATATKNILSAFIILCFTSSILDKNDSVTALAGVPDQVRYLLIFLCFWTMVYNTYAISERTKMLLSELNSDSPFLFTTKNECKSEVDSMVRNSGGFLRGVFATKRGCLVSILILFALSSIFVVSYDPWSWFNKVIPIPPKEQGVYFIGGDRSLKRRGDIVFIHGLDGDPWSTWGDRSADFYWPKWLSEQNPDVGVWTVGYDAASSEWTGKPMGIGDRSENILHQFRNKGIGQRPILLICHSLGGIIAKRMIVDSAVRSDDVNVEFLNQIKGVAYLATPHSGSDSGTLAKIVKAYRPSELVPRLDKDDDTLRNLNISYRSIAPKRNIGTLPLVEKYDVTGVGRVVTESSADPGMGSDVKPIPVNENHITICKPKKADHDVVEEVARFINKYLLPPPEPCNTTLEEFLKDYTAAKQRGDFEALKKTYLKKQFTWEVYVRVSTPQKDTDPDSYPVYAASVNMETVIGEEILGAAFPRYSQTFKDLKKGAKIKLRGVFNERTSSSGIHLKDCELLNYIEGDLVR